MNAVYSSATAQFMPVIELLSQDMTGYIDCRCIVVALSYPSLKSMIVFCMNSHYIRQPNLKTRMSNINSHKKDVKEKR